MGRQVLVDEAYLQSLANSLRTKSGESRSFTPSQMAPFLNTLDIDSGKILLFSSIQERNTYVGAKENAICLVYQDIEYPAITSSTPLTGTIWLPQSFTISQDDPTITDGVYTFPSARDAIWWSDTTTDYYVGVGLKKSSTTILEVIYGDSVNDDYVTQYKKTTSNNIDTYTYTSGPTRIELSRTLTMEDTEEFIDILKKVILLKEKDFIGIYQYKNSSWVELESQLDSDEFSTQGSLYSNEVKTQKLSGDLDSVQTFDKRYKAAGDIQSSFKFASDITSINRTDASIMSDNPLPETTIDLNNAESTTNTLAGPLRNHYSNLNIRCSATTPKNFVCLFAGSSFSAESIVTMQSGCLSNCTGMFKSARGNPFKVSFGVQKYQVQVFNAATCLAKNFDGADDMFRLSSLEEVLNVNIPNMTSIKGMCYGCTSLVKFPLAACMDSSTPGFLTLVYTTDAFNGCINLESIMPSPGTYMTNYTEADVGLHTNLNLFDATNMIKGCAKLDNDSLIEIFEMIRTSYNAGASYSGTKTLTAVGYSSTQIDILQNNVTDFNNKLSAMGWTTGL